MQDYPQTDGACIQERILASSNILSEARLSGLAIQAQLLALEDSITEGHGVPVELLSAWLCAMRQQLKQIDFAIVSELCKEGDHHGK